MVTSPDPDTAHILATLGVDRPVALVTGGARRVGAAICRTFARAGFDVLLTYNQSRDAADTLAASIRHIGGSSATARVDFTDQPAAARFADELRRGLSRLDVLVHNASAYDPSPIETFDAGDARRLFEINALAPAVLSTVLAPKLAASPLPAGGAVVAMCDIHALGRPRPGYLAYAMSKAALGEMVRSLARDLAPAVRVNGVAPGVVAFPDTGPDSDPEMQSRYLSRVPLGRSGTPEDAAEAVRWLALDARYTTGEIVRVDGGRWIT